MAALAKTPETTDPSLISTSRPLRMSAATKWTGIRAFARSSNGTYRSTSPRSRKAEEIADSLPSKT